MASSGVAMSVVGWGDTTLCKAVRDEVTMYIEVLGGVALSFVAMPAVVAGDGEGVG